jgi:hypothetical protein
MKEHPILFSGPMVRAILDGRKTQTRRIVQGVVEIPGPYSVEAWERGEMPRCPYGAPGDRLWVRETWRYAGWTDDGLPWIRYAADGARILCERVTPEWAERVGDHWADLSSAENVAVDGLAADRKWRPSIFLPHWASRLALAVTAVRVERLQAISEADAQAEGVDRYAGACDHPRFGCDEIDCLGQTHRASFAALWDDINGDRAAWESNPWVWVIEFKRIGGAP